MKKVFKIIIILVVAVILAIDFYGLWKYKLSGKQYVLESESDEGSEDTYVEDSLEDLTEDKLAADSVFFIKSIEKGDNGYKVTGSVLEPYEVSKEDYTSLRDGKEVEILGETYKKSQIRSNNLVVKSTESGKTNYYVNYNVTSKKYVLKDNETDEVVYKSTGKSYKLNVAEGTTFVTVKNGKNINKKIEDVAESYSSKEEPSEATANISTSTITFGTNGNCSKIIETER